MHPFFLSAQYFQYLLKAKGAHGIHSSFVYNIYKEVICENRNYYEFEPIEQLRTQLLHSNKTINVIDFGAGGALQKEDIPFGYVKEVKSKPRKVKHIAQVSSITPKKGRLLFRLVNFVQPKIMVELGTSLGISTLYQQKACPEAAFYTLEGSPQTAEIAAENFMKLNSSGIKQEIGSFENTLPILINTLPEINYVFFDGNHRKEATIRYFQSFLSKASENAVFVFDDIRWTPDMHDAWKYIITEKMATVTIDLFSFGLVFIRKHQEKQHFVIKF